MIEVSGSDFSGVIQDSLESVVSVLTDDGQGSGAIIDSEGYIITNFHVIQGAKVIKVLDHEKTLYNVELTGYNTNLDIAVLKISANETFEVLDFGDSDDIKVGQAIVALGNPFGLDFTATQGIVSARRTASDGNEYIQIDVPINPGNSGGPIVDASGEIIGIANFKISGAEGVGFAIPSNVAEEAVNDII
jgi:serine protease Do